MLRRRQLKPLPRRRAWLSPRSKKYQCKGEYVGATLKRQGVAAPQVLPPSCQRSAQLYWAKNMYWRAGKPERFVRPVRWVVALLDSAIVPLEIAGIQAGNASRGIAFCMEKLQWRLTCLRVTPKGCAPQAWSSMWPSAGIRFADSRCGHAQRRWRPLARG